MDAVSAVAGVVGVRLGVGLGVVVRVRVGDGAALLVGVRRGVLRVAVGVGVGVVVRVAVGLGVGVDVAVGLFVGWLDACDEVFDRVSAGIAINAPMTKNTAAMMILGSCIAPPPGQPSARRI